MDAAEPEHPSSMTHVLSWITTKAKDVSGACLQHLARPATVGPLLFTCLCLALAYKNRNRKWGAKEAKVAPRPVLHRSVSMAALHGGKVLLKRIMESQEARIDKDALEDAAKKLQTLLAQERLSFSKLHSAAAKLEMSGKEDEAVEMLQKAWEKADESKQTHEAYELQMLLVEMLIYQGEYEKALKCKCLDDREMSDARGPLYKAVIYTIKGDSDRAKECYKEFQDIRGRFHWPDALKEGAPLFGIMHDFQTFEKVVKSLKAGIEHAHKIK